MTELKKMQKSEMEFIEFTTADVITTSGEMDGVLGQADGEGYSGVTALSGNRGLGNPLQ